LHNSTLRKDKFVVIFVENIVEKYLP
jgi:hypothetical protein